MGNKTLGCDISFWNGVVDFNKMKSAGANFCYIKASQLYADSMFPTYWRGAKEEKILRGAYQFLDWRSSELTQAELFVDTMGGDWGELPPVLDLEMNPAPYNAALRSENLELESGVEFGMNLPYEKLLKLKKTNTVGKITDKNYLTASNNLNYSYTSAEVRGKVWNFLQAVEKATGVVPMIYTGCSYWKQWMTPDPAWLKYFFWLAWYANESIVKTPPPWTKWQLWQYTGNGNGPQFGSEGLSMDMDYFNGTFEELCAWAKTTPVNPTVVVCPTCGHKYPHDSPVPPPPLPPPSSENIYVVTAHLLNVRSGPNAIQYGVVGTLANGVEVTVLELDSTGTWARIGTDRWCSMTYLKKK